MKKTDTNGLFFRLYSVKKRYAFLRKTFPGTTEFSDLPGIIGGSEAQGMRRKKRRRQKTRAPSARKAAKEKIELATELLRFLVAVLDFFRTLGILP